MANHQAATIDSPGMDYAEHERSYRLFVNLMKWGAIHVIVILALLAIFLL